MQQPYYTLLELQRAVEQCNWRKGYGSVCDIRRFGDGRLEVEISRPHMNKTVRFGRVRYNRVFFAGTSAKIRTGEIVVWKKPETKPGEHVVLIDNGARYAIITKP
jgi:hypothetical protein